MRARKIKNTITTWKTLIIFLKGATVDARNVVARMDPETADSGRGLCEQCGLFAVLHSSQKRTFHFTYDICIRKDSNEYNPRGQIITMSI